MPVVTALDLIAFERSMFGRGKYVNGTSGKPIKNSGRREFDCIGFQKWCLKEMGIWLRYYPGRVDPTTVYEFYKNFLGAKGGPAKVGDMMIFGDPHSSDYRKVFAHVGLVNRVTSVGPDRYISMYNTTLEIVEKPLDNAPTMRPTAIMHLGLI